MPIRRIARAALASYFLNEAAKAFTNTKSQAAEAAPFVEFVSRESGKKVPNDPELVVKAQGALMGGAGAALALRIDADRLASIRRQVLRDRTRNQGTKAARELLARHAK